MNTQNRSLAEIAKRSQSGLPRRGMRTGSAPEVEDAPGARAAPAARPAPARQGDASCPADAPSVAPDEHQSESLTAPGAAPDADSAPSPEAPAPQETPPKDMAAVSAAEPAEEALHGPTDAPEPVTAPRGTSWPEAERTFVAEEAPSGPTDAVPRRPLPAAARPQPAPEVRNAWASLRQVPLDPVHLERHRMISAAREDPSHAAFDVLRTRLLQALADNGWRRVAVTSPTKNCGKSFVAANLALSLSRSETVRTLLLDADLRHPSLAKLLGVADPGPISDLLRGRTRPDLHVVRFEENALGVGPNLGLALNDRQDRNAAELLQAPEAAAALARLDTVLRPDVMLFDLPPALYHDDVLALRDRYDGVLLVVGGGLTRPDEITEVSRRLADHTPLLGVVLNRAEGPTIRDYSY